MTALRLLLPLLLGTCLPFAFAPFYLPWLVFPVLAALFLLWWRAPSPRHAAWTGWLFGMGYFGGGVSWVYVSLHHYGSIPAPFAALATALFCGYLALFPALAGWLQARLAANATPAWRLLGVMPGSWLVTEWLRGTLFTGFPWLALGYAEAPHGWLAPWAPVLGVYGVGWLQGVMAGGLALLVAVRWPGLRAAPSPAPHPQRRHYGLALLALGLPVLLAWAGASWSWTRPVGAPLRVSLLQGNVPQDMKWQPERALQTLHTYAQLSRQAQGQLIVFPETALPLFWQQLPPEYLHELSELARQRQASLLLGVVEAEATGDRYYNSVIALPDSQQRYRKSHLVPFGEFIPFKPLLRPLARYWTIPLTDFGRGGYQQRPLTLQAQRIAPNVCYEDLFGEEIIRQLPEATLLVNVSNLAWFNDSLATAQHLQISQMRALETGRMMLRATNTGSTAIIDVRGRVMGMMPILTAGILEGSAQGYEGTTPYVRWGQVPLGLGLLAAALLGYLRRRRIRPGPAD